jgi:hypothetical protein
MCQQLWQAPFPGLVFIWQAYSVQTALPTGNLSDMISGNFVALQLSNASRANKRLAKKINKGKTWE